MRPSRWPVRVRLTALYAGAFLAAGAAMVGATYWIVSRSLRPESHRATRDAHPSAAGSTHDWPEPARAAVDAFRSDVLSSLLTWSLLALAATLVVAIVLGWILAGRALRPLRQITETANRVAGRSLHERIALDGPQDEVKELADTVDAMLERLDRSFDAQSRFVANASHELRTPLAVNRTLLEVALGDPDASIDLKQLAPKLLLTNERSEQLIDGLLILARTEHEVSERAELDLSDLAARALEQLQLEARERHITIQTQLDHAPIEGSLVLMERLAANLVQNAVRHSPPGTTTSVRTGIKADRSFLRTENPGIELRQAEIDKIFEPFQRGEGRVNSLGVGLGLSIVQSIARAHGGQVTALPRDGGGLVIQVTI